MAVKLIERLLMGFLNKFLTDKYYILSDQIFTSLLNFGSIFLLSKFLDKKFFSDFVILYSYITLNNTLLVTVFSAPILVFAVKKWFNKTFAYFLYVLVFFLITGILFSLIEYIFLQKQLSGIKITTFLLMAIGISIIDVAKRYIFSTKVIPVIVTPISSAVMCFLFFTGIFVFKNQLSLNLIIFIYCISYWSSFLLMLVVILLSPQIKQQKLSLNSFSIKTGKSIFITHYHYSKWVLAGGVSFWAYSQGIYIFGDLIGVSDFVISKTRTIQNLFGVFTIIFAALENYLTPLLAKNAMISENLIPKITNEFYKRNSKKFILLSILILPIMYGVYRVFYHQKFGDGWVYILIIWIAQFIAISTKPISIALKAKELTYPLFFSHFFGAVAMIVFAFIFIISVENEWGFILTLLISYIVANFVNYVYYKNVFNPNTV